MNECLGGLVLAALDIMERRTVNRDIETGRPDGVRQGRGIGNVELGMPGGGNLGTPPEPPDSTEADRNRPAVKPEGAGTRRNKCARGR